MKPIHLDRVFHLRLYVLVQSSDRELLVSRRSAGDVVGYFEDEVVDDVFRDLSKRIDHVHVVVTRAENQMLHFVSFEYRIVVDQEDVLFIDFPRILFAERLLHHGEHASDAFGAVAHVAMISGEQRAIEEGLAETVPFDFGNHEVGPVRGGGRVHEELDMRMRLFDVKQGVLQARAQEAFVHIVVKVFQTIAKLLSVNDHSIDVSNQIVLLELRTDVSLHGAVQIEQKNQRGGHNDS